MLCSLLYVSLSAYDVAIWSVTVAAGGDPVAPGHVAGELDMDMAEFEAAMMSESDVEELEDVYEQIALVTPGAEAFHSDVADASVGDGVLDSDVVAEAFVSAAADAFLDEGEVDNESVVEAAAAHDAATASSSSAAPQPWQLLGEPSEVGYVYCEGRSICRIQRGKPAGRVTVTCYRHPGCNLLLNMSRAPENIDIYRWLFQVEAATPEMTKEERTALRGQHTAMGKAMWSNKKK